MDARRLKYRTGITGIALLLCLGCAATNLPSVHENGFTVLDDEERLFNRSKEAIAFFERGGLLYEEKALDEYLNGIYQKLWPDDLRAAHLRPRIKVINQSETNAFALSNGQLYISTSMLTLMDNEAQLAAVIAHEMTHVLERHGLKVKRSTANKAAFFQSVSVIGPLAAFGAVSSISGYSRSVEREADVGGMQAMADHQYDLGEASVVYEKMLQFNKDEDIQEPFFFSTHPGLRNRQKSAQSFMEAHQGDEAGIKNAQIFKEKTKNLTQHTIENWFQGGMYLAAERAVEQYIVDFPDEAEGYYLKGELYRQRQDKEDLPVSLKAYEAALEFNDSLAMVHRGRGILLQRLDRLPEAKKAYQRYLDLNPQATDYAFIKQIVQEQE